MDVYLNQLRRIIDRVIMPQFPELDTYELDGREKNGFHYYGVVYTPKDIRGYGNFDTSKDDLWKDIVTQTRRYYDATGHDEHYLLAAIGEMKEYYGPPPAGAEPPIRWWWKLNHEQGWREKRDRNTQFYADRGNQNR
jgi:hypothetical protein